MLCLPTHVALTSLRQDVVQPQPNRDRNWSYAHRLGAEIHLTIALHLLLIHLLLVQKHYISIRSLETFLIVALVK